MKSGNYDELTNKFYAGTATAEEISLLKSEGLLNEQDALYADTLKEERAQKMNWEFEDFMNEMPSAKVVVLPARRIGLKRIIAAAAVVAAILTAYIFWPQQQTNEIVNVPVINKPFDSNKQLIAKTVLPADETKDSALVAEKVKIGSKNNMSYTVTTSKQSPVKTSIKPTAKENLETKTNFQDYLVMVNGKPITNEADAVAITRESLGMVSRNLTTTVDELKPIGQIKIKL